MKIGSEDDWHMRTRLAFFHLVEVSLDWTGRDGTTAQANVGFCRAFQLRPVTDGNFRRDALEWIRRYGL